MTKNLFDKDLTVEEANELIENGANVNQVGYYGRTPLLYALLDNNYKVVKFLIEKDADVNQVDYKGRNPLFFSCYFENYDLAKFLVENGADINNVKNKDYNPLRIACRRKNFNIVKLLINNKADVNDIENIDNIRKNSILDLAIYKSDIDIINFLKENGAKTYAELNNKTC